MPVPPDDALYSSLGFGGAPPPPDQVPPGQGEEPEPPDGPVPLGYDRGRYFYLSRADGQVHELTAAQHTQMPLMALASMAHYWERTTFVNKRGVAWTEAADWLMESCRKVGVYSPDRLRGRGAYWDDGAGLLHLGDQIMRDGSRTPVRNIDSWYVYEAGARLDIDLGSPVTAAEGRRLRDLCDLLPLETSYMPILLAGWMTIAPVCGALAWRPHLWIVGERASGKSYIMDEIIRPVVGPLALRVQSKTTEAGVRQQLGIDARPVLFDEAETESDRDRDRIQSILDLARQASSEDGAAIVKGSQSGRATTYRVRSCMCWSSVNLGVTRAADESRTIVIAMAPVAQRSTDAAERFQSLRAAVADLLTPAFTAGLLARTLKLLPAIRANADILARAWAERIGSRRQGDTMGSVLAGAWSLTSPKILSLEEARAFLAGHSWVEKAASYSDTSADHDRALLHLLQRTIRHQPGGQTPAEMAIGELIRDAKANPMGTAVDTLKRYGLKLDDRRLWAARSHAMLSGLFSGTPWAASWTNTLAQIPGAIRLSEKPIRFGGSVSRGVGIPMEAVIPPDQ